MVGYKSTPLGSIYCATKAAVHSLSDALGMEIQNYGIKVMVVAPGAIKGEIGKANIGNLKLREGIRNLILPEEDDPEISGSDVAGRFLV
jgi:short-subunit dehydrogenase